jgi:hypothetical protein
MQSFAAGYDLTYAVALKLQLVTSTVMGLTVAKFKPLTIPTNLHCFCLSNKTYIWISIVQDYLRLCHA